MPRAKGADYRIDHITGCWIWLRYRDQQGAPRVSPSKSVREQRAQREYYRRAHGEIPGGHDIVRTCGEPACINPGHADAITHATMLAEVHQDMSPLTWADVFSIRQAARDGIKQDVLCRRYGIASASISKIVQGATWKDPSYRPGVERVCGFGDCTKTFVTRVSNKRYCCAAHRDKQNGRLANGYYERRAAKEGLRRAARAARRSIFAPVRLDAPMAAGASTLGDVIPGASADPVGELEAGELRRLLGDLTEERVRSMSDTARGVIRALLATAGYAPSVLH
jgi:hypothetical protein